MTRLGYQIPNFTYPNVGPSELFDVVSAQARAAESSGFDTVLVMDHWYQLPMLGSPDEFMLECYTLLAGLAGVTERVRLSALVTGNTYRNPAILAKIVTTLDIVSRGRAQLGIGAGWFELEHDSFGIEFGTFTDRFEKLEEALQIIGPMLRGEAATLNGAHYTVNNAVNAPAPIGKIPIMIGGGGEKKTLRMVAQYADESNLIADRGDVPRKLEALAAHCEALGRDRSELTVSYQRSACIAPTMEAAQADLARYFEFRGLDLGSMPDEMRTAVTSRFIVGDPDTVGEQLSADLTLGIDGFTINAPANGHLEGRVELLGQTASKVVFG
ncbi:MAG: LLM class F420-dependent oxidoreductase [Ilumatobacteraceae bacterium]